MILDVQTLVNKKENFHLYNKKQKQEVELISLFNYFLYVLSPKHFKENFVILNILSIWANN